MASRGCRKYKEWRRQVLERDGFKCVKCGQAKYLHCDHIIPWKKNAELFFDISNGQTLCAGCHLKKGREHNEIINDVNTRFKKGQESWCKGKKTGRRAWNLGTKGVCKAWNKGTKGLMATPWNKGVAMSEETKKKISEAKKGQASPMKGKRHTDEAKKKNSEANKGKRRNPNTEFKQGMIPWNKGIKKNDRQH